MYCTSLVSKLKWSKQIYTFSAPFLNFSVVTFHVKVPLRKHFDPLVFSSEHCFRGWSLLGLRGVLGAPQEAMSVRHRRNDTAIDQGAGFTANGRRFR